MLPEIRRSVARMQGSERAQFALALGYRPENLDDFPITEPSLDVERLLQLIDADQARALGRFAPFLEHNPRVIHTLDPTSIREILLPVINARQADVDGTDIPDDEPYTLELATALQSIVPSISFSAIGAPFVAAGRGTVSTIRFVLGIPAAMWRGFARAAGALGRAFIRACRAIGAVAAATGRAILMPFVALGRLLVGLARFIARIPARVAAAIASVCRAIATGVRNAFVAIAIGVRNIFAGIANAIRTVSFAVSNAVRDALRATRDAIKNTVATIANGIRGAGISVAGVMRNATSATSGAVRNSSLAGADAVARAAAVSMRAIRSACIAAASGLLVAARRAAVSLAAIAAATGKAMARLSVVLRRLGANGATRGSAKLRDGLEGGVRLARNGARAAQTGALLFRRLASNSATRGSAKLHDGFEAGVRVSRSSAQAAREAAAASSQSAHVWGRKTGDAIVATREVSRKRLEASSRALTEFGMAAGTALFGATTTPEPHESKLSRTWNSIIESTRSGLQLVAKPIAIVACGALIVILGTTIVEPLLRGLHARTHSAVTVAAATPHALRVQHHAHTRIHHAAAPKRIIARTKIHHAKAPIRIAAIPHSHIVSKHRKNWKFDPELNPFTSRTRVALRPAHRAPRAVASVQIPNNEPRLVSRARLIVTSYLASLMRGDASTALAHLGLSANAPVSNLSEGPVVQRAASFRIVHATLRDVGTAKVDVEITGPQGHYFGVYTVQANGPAAWITDHTVIPTSSSVGYTVRNR